MFAARVAELPVGELVEATDDLRATVPAGCALDVLDMELTHVGRGAARAVMPVASHHLNQAGVVQAGVLVALADAVAGWAAKAAVPPGKSFVTVDLNANILRPAVAGQTLAAVASPVQLGRSIMVINVDVRVLDESGSPGKLVCAFRCTEMVTG